MTTATIDSSAMAAHARSAVYARRDGHPRVLLLGAHLLSAIDRVFYFRSRERKQA